MSQELTECRACPRLVEWREKVATEKRSAFRDEVYWGRPVPDLGDPMGRMLIVGLAPAAHGANRSGRMFTGDRSGDFLFSSLYRTGFASQPASDRIGDTLTLHDCLITAVAHCAPPANKPLPGELENCTRWLIPALARPGIAVIVALGGIAFGQVVKLSKRIGWEVPDRRPVFAHGSEVRLGPGGLTLIGAYHPSQQNTFTGRLTGPMLDSVFWQARQFLP